MSINRKNLNRLTLEDRKIIENHLSLGLSLRKIAKIIKKNHSSVSYETMKNGGAQNYSAEIAHARANLAMKKTSLNLCNSLIVNDIITRLDNLEMQLEILIDQIKEIKCHK